MVVGATGERITEAKSRPSFGAPDDDNNLAVGMLRMHPRNPKLLIPPRNDALHTSRTTPRHLCLYRDCRYMCTAGRCTEIESWAREHTWRISSVHKRTDTSTNSSYWQTGTAEQGGGGRSKYPLVFWMSQVLSAPKCICRAEHPSCTLQHPPPRKIRSEAATIEN